MPDSSNNVNSGARASGTVDWSRPIEAVHPDGRTVSVSLSSDDGQNPDADGDYITTPVLDDGSNLWNSNGVNWSGAPWRIRNVQPTSPERDPALWDRMVARVRRLVDDAPRSSHQDKLWAEARAIVADLPKPVDPDLIEARRIALSFALPGKNGISSYATIRGDADNGDEVQAILAAIKRGRELSRQGDAA